MISETIAERLRSRGVPFLGNDNIAGHLLPGELDLLLEEVEGKARSLLKSLVIDLDHDHNMSDTPRRLAKMYLREVFGGRYVAPPELRDFPNVRHLDELYTLGPITVRSVCSHHLATISGQAWVGVIPGERVIGISKFVRLADWVFTRPQIQEEAIMQFADALEELIAPVGLAVAIRAEHTCMTCRGVRETAGTSMANTVLRGAMRDNTAARSEFYSMIAGQGF